MTRPQHYEMLDLSKFLVSDPRKGEERKFRIDNNQTVSNIDKHVIILECDSYSIYTDAGSVSRIVCTAARSCGGVPLVLAIEPRPRQQKRRVPPAGWELLKDARSEVRYRIPAPDLTEIKSVFENWATFGRWSFASPSVADKTLQPCISKSSIRFSALLPKAADWHFAFTVDLDGMFLGFMKASQEFDRFYSMLQRQGGPPH